MSKRFRFLCPQCGAYQEVKGNGPCWKCHVEVALPTDGLILIYRKSFVPAMMGILLNGYDLGCLGIKECVQIPVQYGHYNVVVKYLDKVMTKYKVLVWNLISHLITGLCILRWSALFRDIPPLWL